MNSGTATSKKSRSGDKRDAILAAAALAFNERGVKAASLNEIAASVGLVTSGITYYFRKKEDLAVACFLKSIAEAKILALEAAREVSVEARIVRLIELHLGQAAAIERGDQPALIHFSDVLALAEGPSSSVLEAYVDMFRCVRALLISPVDVVLTRPALNARAHLLLSVLNSLGGWTGRFEVAQYGRIVQHISGTLLNGIIGSTGRFSPDTEEHITLPAPAPASDDVAESFLLAATVMVNNQGYRGASVDKISSALNATKGKFYRHNDTKFDLITACFDRSFALQRHFLDSAELLDGTGAQRLCAASTALVHFQLSERGPLLRVSAFSALPDEQHRLQVFRTMERLIERMSGMLIDGIGDGSVRVQHTALAARVLHTEINAAAELRRWVPEVCAEDVTRLYTRAVLYGLLCDDSSQNN